MNDFAARLKDRRTALGLTQEALAEKIHVTRQAISNWENGKSLPDLEMLALLSWALEMDVSALLGEQVPPRSRRNLRRALVFAAALALLCLAVRLTFSYLAGLREFVYNGRPQYLYLVLVRPLLWQLGGWTVVAILYAWPGLPPISKKYRQFLFWGGLVWCLFWLTIPFLSNALGIPFYWPVLGYIWIWAKAWLHLPGGIAMALGVLKAR